MTMRDFFHFLCFHNFLFWCDFYKNNFSLTRIEEKSQIFQNILSIDGMLAKVHCNLTNALVYSHRLCFFAQQRISFVHWNQIEYPSQTRAQTHQHYATNPSGIAVSYHRTTFCVFLISFYRWWTCIIFIIRPTNYLAPPANNFWANRQRKSSKPFYKHLKAICVLSSVSLSPNSLAVVNTFSIRDSSAFHWSLFDLVQKFLLLFIWYVLRHVKVYTLWLEMDIYIWNIGIESTATMSKFLFVCLFTGNVCSVDLGGEKLRFSLATRTF